MVVSQARINGQLAIELGSGLDAATVSFVTGLLVVVLIVGATRAGRAGVRALVQAVRNRTLVPWQLIGGFLGAYFVWTQSIAVPIVGVALFIVAVVAGQTVNSLIVDRLGIALAGVIHFTLARISAALIGIVAVSVAVLPRIPDSMVVWWALVASVSAGVLVALQQAVNGRVARTINSSWAASGVNFTLGAAALSVAVLVTFGWRDPVGFDRLPSSLWLYLGGPIGVAFIAAAAWVVPILGVLRFGLVSIAGQLSGAVLLDLIAPTSGSMITVGLLVGVFLAFLAVVVSARR